MDVKVGHIVLYILTEQDAIQINRRRTTSTSIAERIKPQQGTDRLRWPMGAQAHIGNEARTGEEYPMIITGVWASWKVNGQVFLDGNDTLWVERTCRGYRTPGAWDWPERT